MKEKLSGSWVSAPWRALRANGRLSPSAFWSHSFLSVFGWNYLAAEGNLLLKTVLCGQKWGPRLWIQATCFQILNLSVISFMNWVSFLNFFAMPSKWNNRLVLNWEKSTSRYIFSPWLFNLCAEYIMRNPGLEEAQAGIKISGRNINNLRYADDTTLMAESEEELKSLLMKVKEESEKLA